MTHRHCSDYDAGWPCCYCQAQPDPGATLHQQGTPDAGTTPGATMSQQPQQPQQPDESVFAPQPIPGKWTVDVVTSTEGVKAVRVIVEDAAGVAVRFLDPATGEQVAAMMRVAAQQAQTGLFVPPLVMGNGHGSTP